MEGEVAPHAANCSPAPRAAGFRVERVRRFDAGAGWMPANPHVLGVAGR
jgi:hypothetical protein